MDPNNPLDDGTPPMPASPDTSNRTAVIVAVILGICLLASNMGWAAAFALSKTAAPGTTEQPGQTSQNNSGSLKGKTRSIPEIGAKFALDSETQKLTYAYVHDNTGTYIGFSTTDLTDKNIPRSLTTYDCNSRSAPIGRLQILQAGSSYNGQTVAELVTAGKAKQIKNTYVMYVAPAGNCSDDATVTAIQASGIPILKRAVDSLVAE